MDVVTVDFYTKVFRPLTLYPKPYTLYLLPLTIWFIEPAHKLKIDQNKLQNC